MTWLFPPAPSPSPAPRPTTHLTGYERACYAWTVLAVHLFSAFGFMLGMDPPWWIWALGAAAAFMLWADADHTPPRTEDDT